MINKEIFSRISYLKNLKGVERLPQEMSCTTDTRVIKFGIFFAIPGERHNPLEVLGQSKDCEYDLVIYQKSSENDSIISKMKRPNTIFCGVENIISAIQELAYHHAQYWRNLGGDCKVFAISGSNGKTTTKEMLVHVLGQVYDEWEFEYTEKNYNNLLGVPLTLLKVQPQTKLLVLELGSNHPGEIKKLCEVADPDDGLVTNIGATHMEFFPTLKDVFNEEGHLFEYIKSHRDEFFFLKNNDDDFLKVLDDNRSQSFGISPSDFNLNFHADENKVVISHKGQTFTLKNEYILGKHNFINLAVTFIVSIHYFPNEVERIISLCQSFRPTSNRSQWIKYNNVDCFLDAYNANPSSMKSAISGFKDYILGKERNLNQSIVIIGDMNELGNLANKFHQDLGQYVQDLGFKDIIFVGKYSESFSKGITSSSLKEFVSAKELGKNFDQIIQGKRYIFIKGSRSLQLESLLDIS